MTKGKEILSPSKFEITIDRLAYELIENYELFDDSVIIGLQPRGTILSELIFKRIKDLSPKVSFSLGSLDTTFYRDDFRRRDQPLSANTTTVDFLIEDKRVILVDDVLYTGRSIQAALAALQPFGRPKQVELLVLVDRRFNRHLPIKADYIGITVDALDRAYVKVSWLSSGNSIYLYKSKPPE